MTKKAAKPKPAAILITERTKPSKNTRYYIPLEEPRRYPLELNAELHILLWSFEGDYKWTIAYWVQGREGYNLHFIGDRPLDPRVNWEHFGELVRQGQAMADKLFDDAQYTENDR